MPFFHGLAVEFVRLDSGEALASIALNLSVGNARRHLNAFLKYELTLSLIGLSPLHSPHPESFSIA